MQRQKSSKNSRRPPLKYSRTLLELPEMGNSMKTLRCSAGEKTKILKYEIFGIKSSSKMYFEFFSTRYVDLVHQYLQWNSI